MEINKDASWEKLTKREQWTTDSPRFGRAQERRNDSRWSGVAAHRQKGRGNNKRHKGRGSRKVVVVMGKPNQAGQGWE